MDKKGKSLIVVILVVAILVIGVYLVIKNINNGKNATEINNETKETENIDDKSTLKEYKNNDYKFKYNEDWILTPKVDANKVGPNSIYLGALELEIPSTTNSEYSASIYVKTIAQNITLEEYIEEIKKENTKSPSEYYEEISSSEVNFKNQKGYQITAEISDGLEVYDKQDIFTVVNGKVYRITFFGSETEYNNLKEDIDEFISNFEI